MNEGKTPRQRLHEIEQEWVRAVEADPDNLKSPRNAAVAAYLKQQWHIEGLLVEQTPDAPH